MPRARAFTLVAMDADEQLARRLQEEEDRASAAAVAAALSRGPDDPGTRQRRFRHRLEGGVRTALAHEDPLARAAALSVIPLDRLESEAEATLASREESVPPSREDALLRALLRWFKRDFFAWCDTPACGACGSPDVTPTGAAAPTPDEAAHGASRVESYRCVSCGAGVRFPRYNDPVKLLETRAGRCGEWANAFTLCCRALGYDARWVLDWTDHVWTEVWSSAQRRWLHCDACEEACDQPKLYEAGWGKKLTYVVAFSAEGVADVTPRYVVNHAENAGRRDECDETWLARELARITARLRRETDESRRAELTARDASEAKALAADARVDETETLTGRQTGSLEWRAARGELGHVGHVGHVGKVGNVGARDATPDATPDAKRENGPHSEPEPEPEPETEALATAARRLSVRAIPEPETRAAAAVDARETTSPTAEGVGEDRVRAAVRAEFARLMREGGATPNEAAAKALVSVRRRMRELAGATRGNVDAETRG